MTPIELINSKASNLYLKPSVVANHQDHSTNFNFFINNPAGETSTSPTPLDLI
jgi:hypothetical protein